MLSKPTVNSIILCLFLSSLSTLYSLPLKPLSPSGQLIKMQRHTFDCLPMPSPSTIHPREDVHPALSPSITTVPVTPGVDLTEGSSYFHNPEPIDQQSGQFHWNSNSSFAPNADTIPPDSPTRVAKGARSSGELLRRLSLIDSDRSLTPQIDPRAAYPTLNLSGNIISATFCMPHTLGFKSGQAWVSTYVLTLGLQY